MKPTIINKALLISLVIFSHKCFADWINIASSADNKSTIFISVDSIVVKRNFRTVWEVMNYQEVQPNGSLSAKVQQEYDCFANKVRMLKASLHTESFGKGKVILHSHTSSGKWQQIPQNSIATYTSRFVCSKDQL